MVAKETTLEPQGPDDLTAYTGTTPPETVADSVDAISNVELSTPVAPVPGNTFLIRSVLCGRFFTLLDGKIVLGQQDGCSSHWNCVENKYWLGFKNLASGNYLGHSGGTKSDLRCSAQRYGGYEYFAVRPVGGEAYVLPTTFWENLSTVGIKKAMGVESLVTFNNRSVSDGLIWEFFKVQL
ncbi:hypothetical protein DV736_g1509, partial [Chaetothyriales sp. CBS 134916]